MAAIGRSASYLSKTATNRHQQYQQCTSERRGSDMEGHHQAANYASLASLGPHASSALSGHGYANADEALDSWSLLNDPSYAGAVRLLTENLLAAEAAPRLSTSSIESTATSELHTPDNCHQPWPLHNEDGKGVDPLKRHMGAHQDQALSANAHPPAGLQIGGLDGDDARLDATASASPSKAERSNTLKRPAQLSRLSSNVTDATARPSPPASTSPPPRPASTARADTIRLPDVASLSMERDPSATMQRPYARSMSKDSGSESHDKVYSAEPETIDFGESEARIQAGTAGRRILASPDSWRSLLPEHDPFFVPESSFSPQPDQTFGKMSALHAQLPTSPRDSFSGHAAFGGSSHGLSHDRSSLASFDTGRTSFSSALSHKSGSSFGGTAPDSDSWRSFLPDSDRFSLRNAPSPRTSTNSGPLSPREGAAYAGPDQLDPPIILDESGHRAAFLALRGMASQETAQHAKESFSRRHASFSSFEPAGTANAPGSSRPVLASTRRPTVIEAHDSQRGNAANTTDLQRAFSTRKADSHLSARSAAERPTHKMTWVSSSSIDFDDLEDRESWPTSKGRSRNVPSPAVETASDKGASNVPVMQADSNAVPPDARRAKLGETSTSILESTPKGLVATTTTTTTRTATVAKLLVPTGPSDTINGTGSDRSGVGAVAPSDRSAAPGSDSDNALVVMRRSASCSISAPLSPPSLPFLDTRPAPPETELFVETSNTQYTLITHLPGFSIDCITLATKQHKNHRTLHLVADKFDDEGGGHFERRVTFPEGECDLVGVRAEFDGTTLRIFVPRKEPPPRGFSSASSATF
ncbi:hypothetical protein ACQY0O_006731 [Thecaphora frezii]